MLIGFHILKQHCNSSKVISAIQENFKKRKNSDMDNNVVTVVGRGWVEVDERMGG